MEELKHQTDIEINIQEYSSFDDNHAYTRYLYSLINEVCTKSKKRIVLLLDNFDRIVENFDDDGSLLRETLINYNDIQIIAGSTRMDEHFWRHDMPFYEFFRRHRLEALSREEINQLLNHWSDTLEIPVLKDFVKNNPGKIENIRILTDGQPRTLQFFIQIILQKSETNTYECLKKTMDNVSPLFQERLKALPAQLRKMVLEMSFIWEACSTKQLVEKAKMESKLISANLKTLVDKGLVDKIEPNKKQHLYRLSERFFNMWLIVTQGNQDQKRKAKWLSIFLENWYDTTDFKWLASEHISKLKSGEINWNQALVSSKALRQSKYISLEERDTIIELMQKDYPLAEEKLLSAVEKGVAEAISMLALLYSIQKKYSDAEKYYLMAIGKGDISALNNLAYLYYQTNTNKTKALEYINNANSLREDSIYKETKLTIELWNGIFKDVENRMIAIAKEKNREILEEFIIDLLVQQQKTLVLRLFQHAELGVQLQEKYIVLYYATLLLNNVQDENLKLRIPPEIQSTIDEVMEKIANQQRFYASNNSTF